jgi:tetratricopeptide (TPR) repeat protein
VGGRFDGDGSGNNKKTDEPEYHNECGNCLKNLERWAEAEAAYREAINLSASPRKAKYLNNLALLFWVWPDTTRLAEGLQLCEQAILIDLNFPWAATTQSKLNERLHKATQT